MRLEWLEDILAVLETGSFIKAAEKRFITQSAFSRRIKLIENHIGVELFDHSKKPIRLKETVVDQQQNIEKLVGGLRDLRNELKRQDLETHNRIVIACQHAITTSIAPSLVRRLSTNGNFNTRLRSANHGECCALLMTKQVDFILVHQAENEQPLNMNGAFDQCTLDQERFIPVFATKDLPELTKEFTKGHISVIAYPSDSFLGQVVNRQIFSQLWREVTIHKKAETALTLAGLPLAKAGVGVAWLPYSIVAADILDGNLTDLSEMLPSCGLSIVAMRLNEVVSESNDLAWEIISSHK